MAPLLGLSVYLGAVVLALAADAGEPSRQSLTDWVVTLAIAAVVTISAIAVSGWATSRGAESTARTALVLGVLAVLSIVVFWTGIPCVFGAAAIGLSLQARQVEGRFSTPAVAGALLGVLGLVAGAITMLVG